MKLNRTAALLLTGTLISSALIGGCGQKKGDNADAKAGSAATVSTSGSAASESLSLKDIADKLYKEIKYDDELSPMDDGLFESMYPEIPADAVKDKVIYLSTGATAEEIACFEANDDAGADTIEKGLNARVEAQTKSFTDYVPAEVDRLGKAVIVKSGNRVYFSVSGDPDKAKSIIEGK